MADRGPIRVPSGYEYRVRDGELECHFDTGWTEAGRVEPEDILALARLMEAVPDSGVMWVLQDKQTGAIDADACYPHKDCAERFLTGALELRMLIVNREVCDG